MVLNLSPEELHLLFLALWFMEVRNQFLSSTWLPEYIFLKDITYDAF